MPKFIGVLEVTSKYRYGLTSRKTPMYLCKPYDDNLPEFIVGSSIRDRSRDQIVIVETGDTLGDTLRPRANLVQILGPVGNLEAEQKALILHYGSAAAFRKVALDPVDESHDGSRMEICSETGWYTFHIDPFGCRDIDDAIAYNRETGETAITIADAAAYVRPGSELDSAACAIGATFYDLDGKVVLPMLPSAVSEESASLCPGQRRRGVTLIVDKNNKETFVLSWITVQHSFTYESFQDSASCDAHEFIESFMIRYNLAVARLLQEKGAGLLRVQNAAEASSIKHWTAIHPSLGMLSNEAATYVSLPAEGDLLHASIGSVYCHATSPLRRYADIVNQRVIKQTSLQTPPGLDFHLNLRTKANRRWARDLTFLQNVTPGRIHQIDILWISDDQAWVPAWKRIIRVNHPRPTSVGSDGLGHYVVEDTIYIFCDPSKRNWKARVLTASSDFSPPNASSRTPLMTPESV